MLVLRSPLEVSSLVLLHKSYDISFHEKKTLTTTLYATNFNSEPYKFNIFP